MYKIARKDGHRVIINLKDYNKAQIIGTCIDCPGDGRRLNVTDFIIKDITLKDIIDSRNTITHNFPLIKKVLEYLAEPIMLWKF